MLFLIALFFWMAYMEMTSLDIAFMLDENTSILIVIGAVCFVLYYLYEAFTLRNAASKVGLQTPWMAFVPVANTLYRLQIVGDPWWKLFFLDLGSANLITVILLPMVLRYLYIWQPVWIVVYVIYILYTLFSLFITITYRIKYYQTFNIDPLFTLASYVPGVSFLTTVMDALIAYTHLFDLDGNPPTPPTPPVGRGGFTGIAGEYNTAVFQLADGQEMVLGRDPSRCSVVLSGSAAAAVSGKHCSVRYNAADNSYIITDYSKNGTFDGQGNRLPASAKLYTGAIFYLADRQNMFRLG